MGAAAARERVRESLPVGVARERALHVRAVRPGHRGREEGGGAAGAGGGEISENAWRSNSNE